MTIAIIIFVVCVIIALIGIWMQFDVWPWREQDHFGSSSIGE